MIKLIDSCKKARTYLARPSQEYSLLEFSEMLAGDENAITRTEYLGRVQELEHDFHIGMIAKVFNDLLGFRTLCDNYEEVLEMAEYDNIRIADMSSGKARDDGY